MLAATRRGGITAPASSRRIPLRNIRPSDVESESARRGLALAGGAQAAQAADEQRVVHEGLGTVDEGVQDLVVAGRGHVELVADCCFLGAGVLPPLTLEVQDLAIALRQGGLLGLTGAECL